MRFLDVLLEILQNHSRLHHLICYNNTLQILLKSLYQPSLGLNCLPEVKPLEILQIGENIIKEL